MQYARDDATQAEFVRVQRIVHEGVLALRALPSVTRAPRTKSGYWPDYPFEFEDWGAHDGDIPFRPTPQQVDHAYQVAAWYGAHRETGRDANGLHEWQWRLLEVRAFQTLFGRASWQDLADQLNRRANYPTYSREHWRRQHIDLIEIAMKQDRRAKQAARALRNPKRRTA